MKRIYTSFVILTVLAFSYLDSHSQPTIQRGVVKGRVLVAQSNAPIPGAIVMIYGDTLTRISDQLGDFRFDNVPVGYRTLTVIANGYPTYKSESFDVTTGNEEVVNVYLEAVKFESVIVTAAAPLRQSVEAPLALRRIGREEIDLTPGANRDISKVVQSTPGVVTVAANNRNDLLVRGGGANENKYFIDGIEIPVLNHFSVQGGSGGYASLVNTELLSGVNFYTGAFPAALSSGLSSVLDMRMKSGNSDHFMAKLSVGASDIGITFDTPLSKNGKTTFVGSYRRSYLQLLFSALQLPFLPTYNDYQFKLSSQISENDELYVLGVGSFDENRLNLDIKNPSESRKYIIGYLPNSDQNSYVVGAGYRHGFENGQFQVTASRDFLSNYIFKFENNDDRKPLAIDLNSREVNYRFRATVDLWNVGGFKIGAGVGGGYGSYSSLARQRANSITSNNDPRTNSSVDYWRYDLFATASRYFFEDRLSVLVGLRMDGMTYSFQTSNPLKQLSPRVSLSYQISPKWSANATVARYYQEPTYTTLGYVSDDINKYNQRENLKYLSVNQYLAGIKFTPNAESVLILEGFFKQYNDLPVSLIDSLPISTGNLTDYIVGNVPARSVGKGQAYGAELSYRNLDFFNTVINVSYTLLYSRLNKMDQDLRPVDNSFWSSSWDVRHIFNVSAIHKFASNWTLGAKWYLTGGLPYTPYDLELSSQIENWENSRRPTYDNNQYNFSRAGVYHQLDVRVDKVWNFKKWRLGFYVDIQNLYNFKSKGQDILMPQLDENGNYIIDPKRPGHYLMQTIENNMGGTILPTIGLTIQIM